jgi:hypothetical protein
MGGLKSFGAACSTLSGMEVMPAMRKGSLDTTAPVAQPPAEQF